jgi:ATP-binding cassette subfamily C protein
MANSTFILKTFRLLAAYKSWNLVLVFILTLLTGIFSGFSIVLLIPLLQLLNIEAGEPEGFALTLQNILEKSGISLTLETILAVYFLVLSLSAFLQYLTLVLETRYQQTFIYDIRRRLFRKIIMADWQVLNSRGKTNHLQILTREVPNLANYFYYFLRLLTTMILTASYIVYALMISAGLSVIIVITGLISFLILRKFLFKAFRLGEDYVSSYDRLIKYIDDFWQTVKIAKVHSSEEFYFNRFDEASSSLLDLEYKIQKNWSLPQFLQRIAGLLVLGLMVYIGYRSAIIPVASFIILILLFSRIFPQFISVNTDINMIVSNIASASMVIALDEDFPEEKTGIISGTAPLVLREKIIFEDIMFTYPDGERIFNNFNGAIDAFKITAIVGVSGRGKTTLIDLIAGLQRPDSGRILVDGMILDSKRLQEWKSGIGYLPQSSFFIDGTFRENLIWDSTAINSDNEIWDVLEKVNAVHLVRRYKKGLDAFIVNYPFTFSGGECQRLALARVLLRKPSLLLLDEATSSLDTENESVILNVLGKLKEKITVVVVTHRESVMNYVDEVIHL